MAFGRRKGLTQKEIEEILLNYDLDDSDIDVEENFSGNNRLVLCTSNNPELIFSEWEKFDSED